MYSKHIRAWLNRSGGFSFSAFAILAAFSTYFCMYAYRKPFAAGTFEGLELWGVEYKIVLVVSQVFGYTLSKFLGIKFVSEIKPHQRVFGIILLIGLAEVALLFVGLVPSPYQFIFMFLNGLPLGMIWGLVFSFLEGRRYTEALGAGLSASFIVSSGVVKAVGLYTMQAWGVTEFWMPFVTGLIFFFPLLFSVWLLGHLPPPNELDRALRTERVPMTRADRKAYFSTFAMGLGLLIIVHMLLTAYRDFRDNFSIEILNAIGYGEVASNLAKSEVPITIAVLLALGFLIVIRNNRRAFNIVHLFVITGVTIAGLSTLGFQMGYIDPYLWYILVGMGLYLGYVPFQCILYERMIALFRHKANAGFLIYVSDATGYLASVGVLLYKNFAAPDLSWLDFFVQCSYILAIAGVLLMILSYLYFEQKATKELSRKPPNWVKQPTI